MKSWIVRYNYGYGDEYAEVDAMTNSAAMEEAERLWREGAEDQASFGVEGEATDELREDLL